MPLTLEMLRYPQLTLLATTAADLMTPNPVSISADATLREALALLTDRGIRAAPVIGEAGRPIGVLSSTDLLIHERESVASDHSSRGETETAPSRGYRVERVRDVMTPAVFSVTPTLPAEQVVREMVRLNVHRVFVVDESNILVGVISALDILRRLDAAE